MFKVKNNLSPKFIQELFTYNEHTNKFMRPNVRTVKMGQGSLLNFGPIVWNTMLGQAKLIFGFASSGRVIYLVPGETNSLRISPGQINSFHFFHTEKINCGILIMYINNNDAM